MIIHAVSDLHGHTPELPGGDLLIVAGDCTARDTDDEWKVFADWLEYQDYKAIILVAGNHDGELQKDSKRIMARMPTVRYLQDEPITVQGLKVYGSPWTPEFCNWHFMKPRGKELKEVWDKMPSDLDILVTHGPPHGILDECEDFLWGCMKNVGDLELRNAVEEKKPRYHIFGHVHLHGNESIEKDGTTFFNVSAVDESYQLTNSMTVLPCLC